MIAVAAKHSTTRKVNKSQVVRDFIKGHPDFSNKKVAEALKKRGVGGITNVYVGVVRNQSRLTKPKRPHTVV